MIIQHTDKHHWIKVIDPLIFPDFGKNNTKKIQALLSGVSSSDVTHLFEPLTPAHIEWFDKLYTVHLATKHNPRPYNVFDTTLGKDIIVHPYFILTLLENGTPIGGTIFTLRKDRLSMVYRTYPADWAQNNFKCSPALYAEFLATKYALAQNKPRLVHGVDTNPYGVNSHVGVAIFKLSTGCHAEIKSTYLKTESDLNTLPYKSLVLAYPISGNRITDAFLIGDTTTASQYEQLFKYPEQLKITLFTPSL